MEADDDHRGSLQKAEEGHRSGLLVYWVKRAAIGRLGLEWLKNKVDLDAAYLVLAEVYTRRGDQAQREEARQMMQKLEEEDELYSRYEWGTSARDKVRESRGDH